MSKYLLQLCIVNHNENLARSSCFDKCGKTEVAEVIGCSFYNFLLRMDPPPSLPHKKPDNAAKCLHLTLIFGFL
jgi:hypothetical protein